MSIWGHRVSVKLIVTAVTVLLLGVFAVAVTRPEPREIRLVAKGMAFYLEGVDVPNPTIVVKPGERVRIVLNNQDRGLRHDFAVPALSEALEPISWNQSDDVVLDVPAEPGIYDYWCRPHMTMMRGKIQVSP